MGDEELVLFRGMCLPEKQYEGYLENLSSEGITGEGGSNFYRTRFMFDFRDKLEELYGESNLSQEDTKRVGLDDGGPQLLLDGKGIFQVTWSCGTELGASYYAIYHQNKDGTPQGYTSFIIKFKVPISDVYIDPVDFLYPSFNLIRRSRVFEQQLTYLKEIYGPSIERYFLKAVDTTRKSVRDSYAFAMCDLACQDIDIARAHAENRIIIWGKRNTKFCSSFKVRVPIEPRQIISVEEAEWNHDERDYQGSIRWDLFLKGLIDPI